MPEFLFFYLRIADAFGIPLLAARLLKDRLHRVYPALFAHTVLETFVSLALLPISTGTLLYAWIFIGASVLRWVLWSAIVWHLYRSSMDRYSSFRTIAKVAVLLGALTVIVPVFLTRGFDFAHVGPNIKILPAVFLIERTVTGALALFVLSLCTFAAWFQVPIRRNCVYLCLGFGLIFATRSAVYSLRNALGPDVMRAINLIDSAVSVFVFYAWAIALNPAGEQTVSFVGKRPGPLELEHAIRSLKGVNSELKQATSRHREG